MTEFEWLTSDDPWAMLDFAKGKMSGRKARLFACACYRHTWGPVARPEDVQRLDVAERFADGKAGREEVGRYSLGCASPCWHFRPDLDVPFEEMIVTSDFVDEKRGWDFDLIARSPAERENYKRIHAADMAAERVAQSALARCIIGNLFRPTILDPSWLTPAIVALAQAIYDDRRFNRMPELGDVLEAARCTNAEILTHCRGPGPHVRGCWVVDVLLGKE